MIIDQPGGQGHVSKSGASSGPLTQPSQLIRVMMMIMIILMIGGMIMIRVMMMIDDQNQS